MTTASTATQLLLRLDPATRALVEAAAGTVRLSPADWLDLRVIQGARQALPVEVDLPVQPVRPPAPRPAPRSTGGGIGNVGAALEGLRNMTGATAGRMGGRVRGAAGRFGPRIAPHLDQVRRRIASHPLVHHRVQGRRTVLVGAAAVVLVLLAGIWLMRPSGGDGSSGTTVQIAGQPPAAQQQAAGRAAPGVAPSLGTPGNSTLPNSVPDSAAALAAATFREKAEKNDPTAQHDLGVLYADGRGVPRDYAAAAKWFGRAAASGMANAQFNLAVLTERGLGVAANLPEAARLYRAAAEQGHPGAQYNLGIVLAEGRGLPQDYPAAATWFRRAADQGFAKAAYNLGVLHERGLTGAVDDLEAYRWYARALESGDGDAKERMEQIARRLPPQDLNQARQRPIGSADPALVADLQRLLTARGYKPGAADGSFGERTADAIRRFQRDEGIAQDGLATPELLRRLEAPSPR
ncbi:Sel1 repeat-containing protein [Stella humosa]|uniref:Sel1 repeat-containing protein n=1 Tax=Stella humosa TaxID=94 RepID=A0A3N1L0X2_9PROT|nr:SEL1-like repeat protein [Stella humosa]ROP84689.1 Sel1 repeat-containing protein [Stella humosa]BBK34209.1 hypothetical protein STHU_48430 [Stella humosa]